MYARAEVGSNAVAPRWWAAALAVATLAGLLAATPPKATAAPAGFRDRAVLSGLNFPTAAAFAPDGRVFVAERSGIIKVFDGLGDTSAVQVSDLRTKVQNMGDRGLLGLALDPAFPTRPYLYALYTHDAEIGGTAPRWGDSCPDPRGNGCVVSGRLSRLTLSGDKQSGGEKILIEDWCQQFTSHSIGTVTFGPNNVMYVGGGEGASYTKIDYGQYGDPVNPCGDPPGGVGGSMTKPGAQGGALRSQDFRSASDPLGLGGTIARVNPDTGAWSLVAAGLRNPFRFTFRPGTGELWTGDVGSSQWEEINRVPAPTDGVVDNFGWPCYEGSARKSTYDNANLTVCEQLYSAPGGAVSKPYWAYSHSAEVVAGDGCGTGQSSISSLTFYSGTSYPASYKGALFFGDYARGCMWVMLPGSNGLPDPATRRLWAKGVYPVQMFTGPGGDVFYIDAGSGTLRRITYEGGNQSPDAVVTASRKSGAAPLSVSFDASGSTDPDGDTLTFTWDLNGDGVYGDATGPTAAYTYEAGTYTVRVRVADPSGATDTASVFIEATGDPPTPVIDTPASGATWSVGQGLQFSGSATDPEDGTLPPSALSWRWILHHCSAPDSCHTHLQEEFEGTASGTLVAPDHAYPAYLEVRLTATDSSGQSATVSRRFDPKTTTLQLDSVPSGLKLEAGEQTSTAPFTKTVIVGSQTTVTAPSPQSLSGTGYVFQSWSDGGAQSHDVEAGTDPKTLTATYASSGASDADMAITKTAKLSSDRKRVVFTLTSRNQGPATATGVVATDWLASGVDFVSATTTKGTCSYVSSSRTVTCQHYKMLINTTATVTVTANLSRTTSFSNTGRVKAQTPDPVTTNNASTAKVTLP